MSIAIVYFSGFGGTKKQAEAVLAGTGELGVLIEIDKGCHHEQLHKSTTPVITLYAVVTV